METQLVEQSDKRQPNLEQSSASKTNKFYKKDKVDEARKKSKNKHKDDLVPVKTKSLVEELKIFQNNNLLNQQDPLQQLHRQLNALNQDFLDDKRLLSQNHRVDNQCNTNSNNINLTSTKMLGTETQLPNLDKTNSFGLTYQNTNDATLSADDNHENIFTIKKGILWQQQNYDKFHKRLFNRWKKRYFILTTDYLVCFKRSSSKVGCSEMGKFLYKTSLGEIVKVDWLKPRKSDKGPMILDIRNLFQLQLWTKDSLDDWMFLIRESINRHNNKRAIQSMEIGLRQSNTAANEQLQKQLCNNIQPVNNCDDLYENAALSLDKDAKQSLQSATEEGDSSEFMLNNTTRGQVVLDEQSTAATSEPSNCSDNTSQNDKLLKKQGSQIKSPVSSSNADSRSSNSHKEQDGRTEASRSIALNESDSSSREHGSIINDLKVNRMDEDDDSQASGKSHDQVMIYERQCNDETNCSSLASDGQTKERSGNDSSLISDTKASSVVVSSNNRHKSSKKCTNLAENENKTKQFSLCQASGDDKDNTTEDSLRKQSKQTTMIDQNCNEDRNVKKTSSNNQKRLSQVDSGNSKVCDNVENPIIETNQATHSDESRKVCNRSANGNLIRRDDSWQSLVSLGQVGKSLQGPMLDLQHPFYGPQQPALHQTKQLQKLPQMDSSRAQSRQHLINIESTITPLRGPLMRQKSLQVAHRALRPFPTHAASFDLAPGSPSPQANHQQQQQQLPQNHHQEQRNLSYHHKLLQLQLLHNSNNVDYIRQNGDQIYGPESTYNHYGYYSMRSNLKSAASEFSFIRPTAKNANLGQSNCFTKQANFSNQQQQQNIVQFLIDSPNKRYENSAQITSPMALKSNQIDANNNEISPQNTTDVSQRQFLVNPITGDRLTSQQLATAVNDVSLLIPPIRDLPMKPNKRRLNSENNSSLQKSSSLTTSIVQFFRRAFSKRAKRNNRGSKLAESCSSSLATFDDNNFSRFQVVPSAFSTGSKSVEPRSTNNKTSSNQLKTNTQGHQKMVDMIEAFANKNNLSPEAELNGHQSTLANTNNTNNLMLNGFQPVGPMRSNLDQFGSPLHKSNSISATMGIADRNGRHTLFYENENSLASNAYNSANESNSPILMRSSKVLSANLTPLMVQRERALGDLAQSYILSPGNSSSRPMSGQRGHHQLPRPSSIYGQPSMISSPLIRASDDRNNFGLHRSSLHNPNATRIDRHNFVDDRRHPSTLMKLAHPLDPTSELVEETPSPTHNDNRPVHYGTSLKAENILVNSSNNNSQHEDLYHRREVSSSKSSGKLNTGINRAVVNPIFQSPTMDAIYDNHPMMMNPVQEFEAYSHYDNHNQLLMAQSQGVSQNHRQSHLVSGLSIDKRLIHGDVVNDMTNSPSIEARRRFQPTDTQSSQHSSPYQRNSVILSDGVHAIVGGMGTKPAAIVAPTTPGHHQPNMNTGGYGHSRAQVSNLSSPVFSNDSVHNTHLSMLHKHQQNSCRSPIQSRRNIDQYRQSPLVNRQTRVISKGDGVQATTFGDHDTDFDFRSDVGQPVVNIAGAPGVSLEPSLAASLLKGTNIDAYELLSTPDRFKGHSMANPKTFVVSTRLSKSMAQERIDENSASSSSSSSVHSRSSAPRNANELASKSWKHSSSSASPSSSSHTSHSNPSSRTSDVNLPAGQAIQNIKRKGSASSEDNDRTDRGNIERNALNLVDNREIRRKLRYTDKSSIIKQCSKETNKSDSSQDRTTSDDAVFSKHDNSSIEEPDDRHWINSKLLSQ